MCEFKSAIVLKDRVYVADHDHHDEMLTELGISDVRMDPPFVRVELSPVDDNKESDVDGWMLKVDQDILPDWWVEEVDLPRIKDAIKAWQAEHVFTDGTHEVKDGIYYASGNATVRASDNATVRAWGNATVIFPKNWYGNPNVTVSGYAVYVNHNDRTVMSESTLTVIGG